MPSRSADDDPRLGDISEGTVLRAILARTAPAAHTLVGPGDDAAVLAAPSGSVVATTDTLVHGPDFRLAWSSGYDLGWKAAAVNLADIAALGARPTGLLVALGALGTWLVGERGTVEWTTSSGTPARVRGSDRRVTALTRTIDRDADGDARPNGLWRKGVVR